MVSRPLFAAVFLFAAAAALAAPPWLPIDPGNAHCAVRAGGARLDNHAVTFSVADKDGTLRPGALNNGFTHHQRALTGELFSLTTRDGKTLAASELHLDAPLTCERIKPQPKAARAAARRGGVALHATFSDKPAGLHVDWRAVLRDGTNYVREIVRLTPSRPLDVKAMSLIDLDLADGWIDGTVDGSPIIAGNAFFGFEQPMSRAKLIGGHATMTLTRKLPLRAGVGVTYSAVFGVVPAGQLRRGFLAYLENERAHPYRQFLHYNSWYDIGYFNRYNETEALTAINAMGTELVKKRGVDMKSFLFDDGWDDPNHLWQFNKGFPHGFTPLKQAAAKYGAGVGLWLSPWGGYGEPRHERLAAARKAGYAVDDQGIALSGPKYYKLFHSVTLKLLKDYGINLFKLDGTGSPDKVTPGSAFDSDFAAAIALIHDLRRVKPDLFINLTTGTWPSPFWLRTADSIWRGGWDHSFAGVGSDRQRWITYRDADTYGGIVRQGPLYPLNSLMLHGILYARHAQGLNSDPHHDFPDEVWSYFATGTDLQGLYISADLLTDKNWDTLAAAAKWAQAHADVLRDSHWIGGDPARLEVYGWASWMPHRAIIALRNPSNQPQTYRLDVGAALELPPGAEHAWHATSPNEKRRAAQTLHAGKVTIVTLKPFEVLVWDLQP